MRSDITFVSTYLPRKCGIATFTHSLAKAFKNTFPGEIHDVRIAPIDNGIGQQGYQFGADPELMIDQENEHSWHHIASKMKVRAIEIGEAPIFVYEHEHGLDAPNGNGFISLASTLQKDEELKKRGLVTVAQLHTVVKNPSVEHKNQIRNLTSYCDLVTIMAEKGKERLRDSYDFTPEMICKVRVIEHGVRPFDPMRLNRTQARESLGINSELDLSIVTGYRGEAKGIDFIVQAFGKHFETLSKEEKDRTKLAVIGMYHPWFKTPEGRPSLKEDLSKINKVLKDTGLKTRSSTTNSLEELGSQLEKNAVVFGTFYLDEQEYVKVQIAGTKRIVGNRDREQLSSGTVIESAAHGATVTTRTEHALGIARPRYPNAPRSDFEKRTIGENAMLVDLIGPLRRAQRKGQKTTLPQPSIEQMAYCMNVLSRNENLREELNRNGIFNIGQPHSWNLIARKFMNCIEEVRKSRTAT